MLCVGINQTSGCLVKVEEAHLLVVVVVGVDVVVVLLVSHVLLITQLAVETGVSVLLQRYKDRKQERS